MKIRTIVAASALAATGVIGGVSQSASAGCGVTLNVDNDKNTDVTVHWDVQQGPGDACRRRRDAGRRSGTTSVNLDADTSGGGDDVLKALNLTFSCGTAPAVLRSTWTDGQGNSGYEYHNETGPAGSWTTYITPFIDIE